MLHQHHVHRGQLGRNPLYKIRLILDCLNFKFGEVYTPEESLTIDEATCVHAFQGRIHFWVFMQWKSLKYGIKVSELCEACKLEVYQSAHSADLECNISFSAVNRLWASKNKGYTVYKDR
jgi:hypothetical protein